jgi:hypothetical protein|tara:strand:+ start:40 stop:204 length:165 start_codon:yes stop_codon:yes gene_type:complete
MNCPSPFTRSNIKEKVVKIADKPIENKQEIDINIIKSEFKFIDEISEKTRKTIK